MASALAKFRSDKRAAAAVEFALVGGLLIFTILFVLFVALTLFIGQSLDLATQRAARKVMTGAVQSANLNQTLFRTTVVCSFLPSWINCDNVIVNLYTVPQDSQPNGYYAFTVGGNASGLLLPTMSNASSQYSLGIQGQFQYLLVVYPITFIPSASATLFGTTTAGGKAAYPVVATAAFRNEQY